jgi:two-component system, OmpR family, response regulator CpxR
MQIRVLVVDDEPDACEIIREELQACSVECVRTYDDARARLAANAYDVVLLDIMGVRGFELLDEFGARHRCVMLTAHALNRKDFDRAKALKAVLFLSKEEIGTLEEYVRRAATAHEPLWDWLAKRVEPGRWFAEAK